MQTIFPYLATTIAFSCFMVILVGLMEFAAWLLRPSQRTQQRQAWVEGLFNGGSLWKP